MTESARQVEATGASGLTTAQKDLDLPDGDEPLEIEVSGQQWLWRYEYPDGTFSYYEMVVPVDTEVVLNLDPPTSFTAGGSRRSAACSTPSPATQPDLVQGRRGGRLRGPLDRRSRAPPTPQMRAQVRGQPAEYEAWLAQQAADIQDAQDLVRGPPSARAPSRAAAAACEGR